MPDSEQMADQFVDLAQRFLRQHPKLAFPDDRVAAMKQQLRGLRESSSQNPEDRMFLFRILAMLKGSETPPTMGEISGELGIPLSSATRMVDGLVHAKFAERRADPNDRRVVRLCMTGSGEQFIETGMNFLKQRIQQLLKHFTAEEQAQLLHLTKKLIDSLQAEKQ
jgi:DNA-binding MarR family transcriptional regulator